MNKINHPSFRIRWFDATQTYNNNYKQTKIEYINLIHKHLMTKQDQPLKDLCTQQISSNIF